MKTLLAFLFVAVVVILCIAFIGNPDAPGVIGDYARIQQIDAEMAQLVSVNGSPYSLSAWVPADATRYCELVQERTALANRESTTAIKAQPLL